MNTFDVTIVGLGPTGATLANLLSGMGLSVCVIEADDEIYPLPRATHFDGETMRVFQSIGLAKDILPFTHVNPGMTFINADREVILDWPRPREVGPQNWHPSYRFHQPPLEAVLRKGLERFERNEIHTGCEFLSYSQTGDGVVTEYQQRSTGETRTVSSRYLVGCDGGRSPVRNRIGSVMEDVGGRERWIVVDLLMKRSIEGLTEGTVQYCNPIRPTTYMRCVGNRRRWEFMVMPGDDTDQMTTPEGVWHLLSPWLTTADAEIERAVLYTFHPVVGRPWRDGRVFLAGDAAHLTPPFLGQGMCSGIRDAANLAWKLARVIQGRAPDALLDSYEQERSPHVRRFIEHAVQIGGVIQVTDAESARKRDEELAKGPRLMTSIVPQLGPGLHGSERPPAGMLSHQPILASGLPLDDVVGAEFAILGEPAVLDTVSPATRDRWREAGAVVLPGEAAAYLAELGAKAVIIRPDRYILGIASSPSELDRLSERLPANYVMA